MYASGEYPEVGDIVTKRGYKPTRPAVVIETDGDVVKVRWGSSKSVTQYLAKQLVLVTPFGDDQRA